MMGFPNVARPGVTYLLCSPSQRACCLFTVVNSISVAVLSADGQSWDCIAQVYDNGKLQYSVTCSFKSEYYP